ncbi:MAG: glycosyltransferase family 2 protein [Oscillospiraceae bacterium]|nr:glycosyltransferase family 2 protein [Oscillospiraceae bacterium]
MENKKLHVSVCIVTYNDSIKALNAIESIISNTTGVLLDLYISDNASLDNFPETIKTMFPQITVIKNDKNGGFGFAHNKVIDLIDSDYHAIINPDVLIDSDVLTSLCNFMEEHKDVAMVTPKVLSADGTEQHLPKLQPKLKYMLAGRISRLKSLREEYTRQNENISSPCEIDFCTGCFMLIRTSVFKQLGGFDERFFMYMEDADLTRRTKKFGKVMFIPNVQITHLWERISYKSLKYLLIHVYSMLKFFFKYMFDKEKY